MSVFMISFLIVGALFALVFWKIIKANDLFPVSLKAWRQMRIVEGELKLSWKIISPLWQRIVCVFISLTMLTLIVVGSFQGWFEPPREILSPLLLMVWGIVMVVSVTLYPQRYQMTDRGLWCTTASVFGNPESTRYHPRRLVWWDDVVSVAVKNNKIILHKRLPDHQDGYRLPFWMLKVFKRVEVPLSGRKSELGRRIVESIQRYCPETRKP